jgi:TatD DNase family protein
VIDTHCHLTYEPLAGQIEAVLGRAAAAGVDGMISVGTSPEDAEQAVGLAGRYAGVYATAGVHPHHAAEWADKRAVQEKLRRLMSQPKVVAIGEMGLDRHYEQPSQEDQRRVFGWQLEVAAELPQPVVIHNREATGDVLAMIRDSGIVGSRFVFHCFTGSVQELEAVLAIGAMVGFTGIVTFKNARALAAASVRVPVDRLMVETDSPYLTPEPYRKVQPNEPCYVPWVARFLAGQRGMDEAELVRRVDANARVFFRI